MKSHSVLYPNEMGTTPTSFPYVDFKLASRFCTWQGNVSFLWEVHSVSILSGFRFPWPDTGKVSSGHKGKHTCTGCSGGQRHSLLLRKLGAPPREAGQGTGGKVSLYVTSLSWAFPSGEVYMHPYTHIHEWMATWYVFKVFTFYM